MIFTTYWFFAFAFIIIGLFWVFRVPRWRIYILILGSALFHAHFAGPAGFIPIVIIGSVTYLLGVFGNKKAIIFGIVFCTVALLAYKYSAFFCTEIIGYVNKDAGEASLAQAHKWLPSAAPLAISFFVFEFVHYLSEVYSGHAPIRKVDQFVLFSIFFPSLAAGPIKRYESFLSTLKEGVHSRDTSVIYLGLFRVLVGFFKKVVIADNLTAWISYQDSLNPTFESLPYSIRLLMFFAIAMRIYFDFSGYSDIAIGLAQMMGIRLPENFNFPYLARNIQDFWQRWHMSLSSWVRDYIYIPLGGNRVGLARKIGNGLVAFGIIGLWHGAEWNFIVWGLYHGLGLAIYNLFTRWKGRGGRIIHCVFEKVPLVSWMLTQVFVWVGWLLFFYPISKFTGNFLSLLRY